MLTSGIIPTSFAVRSFSLATSSAATRSVPGSVASRTSQGFEGAFAGAAASILAWASGLSTGAPRSRIFSAICRSPGRPLASRSSAAASTIRCDAMASRPLSRSLDRCGATSVITWSSRLSAALPDSRSACSRNSDLCSSSRCCSKRASCSFWRVASLQYPYANANDTTNANAAITASNELGFFASADIPAHEARAVPPWYGQCVLCPRFSVPLRDILERIVGIHVPVRLLAVRQLGPFPVVRHILVGNPREQVVDHVQARAPLVVGTDHVPGREGQVGGGEHRVPRAGVVVPAAVRLEVHGRELPDLASVV